VLQQADFLRKWEDELWFNLRALFTQVSSKVDEFVRQNQHVNLRIVRFRFRNQTLEGVPEGDRGTSLIRKRPPPRTLP
jgi:hypothetical protein